MSLPSSTALTSPDHDDTLRGLKRVLSNMVLKICEAEAELDNSYRYMERAQDHARMVQQGLAAWATCGRCAGLSMVSGLLLEADTFIAAEHVEEFTEVCWRAHGIGERLSPYADDVDAQDFIGAFDKLSAKIKEAQGR